VSKSPSSSSVDREQGSEVPESPASEEKPTPDAGSRQKKSTEKSAEKKAAKKALVSDVSRVILCLVELGNVTAREFGSCCGKVEEFSKISELSQKILVREDIYC